MVWADTEEIGCGWTYYAVWNIAYHQKLEFKSLLVQEQVGPFLAYKSLTICNYAKGGNAANRPMYLAGPACTECPEGFTCEDHLCTK